MKEPMKKALQTVGKTLIAIPTAAFIGYLTTVAYDIDPWVGVGFICYYAGLTCLILSSKQ